MQIISNNQPRELLSWHELTPAEQEEFNSRADDESGTFFRYRGNTYDTGEFLAVPPEIKQWDGYSSDSYFSGICIRFVNWGECIVVGRFYA